MKIRKLKIWLLLITFVQCYVGMNAQQMVSPGNTSYEVEFWLKSDRLNDNPLPQNGTEITQWTDANGKIFTGNTGSSPVIKYDGMCFNPAINFSTKAKRLVSNDNFQKYANTTRIYRSFYVSKSNVTANNTYGAIFAYSDNYDEGWYANANYLYYNVGTGTGLRLQ